MANLFTSIATANEEMMHVLEFQQAIEIAPYAKFIPKQ